MKKHTLLLFLSLSLIITISGCSFTEEKGISTLTYQEEKGFQNVEPEKAYQIFEENKNKKDFIILDIRTPEEFLQGHLPQAQLLNFYDVNFEMQINTLDTSKTYLVYCRSGNRSSQSKKYFEAQNFQTVYNLKGGYNLWLQNNYPISQE